VRSLNLIGLQRSGLSEEDLSQLKKAFRLIYRSEMSFAEALKQLELVSENSFVQHFYRFLHDSTNLKQRRGTIPGK
jgi:UDP-N-acetylglucosamine acyltransferase